MVIYFAVLGHLDKFQRSKFSDGQLDIIDLGTRECSSLAVSKSLVRG